MAKRKVDLELTPLMALSVMAIFMMMLPLVALANSRTKARMAAASKATPEPEVVEMEE